LLDIHRELVTRNGIEDGLIYLQVTRGAADRDFAYPPEDTEPTMVLFTQAKPGLAESPAAKTGIKVISIEDQRWGRRDIKTVQLLYPSMGKMMAKAAGCDDAWMVEDGHVTEGTSNNAYIVKGNTIVTRHLGTEILHGITRAAVLRFAREAQMRVEERPFTIDEAKGADEAFITSASSLRDAGGGDRRRGDRRWHAGIRHGAPARGLPRRDAQGRGLRRFRRLRAADRIAAQARFLFVSPTVFWER
jgi:D-alanine transaminase